MIFQMDMMDRQGMMLQHTLYSTLWTLVILALFFLIIWWILKGSNGFGFRLGNETALDILKKRLARGEINDKEFRKLKKEIE